MAQHFGMAKQARKARDVWLQPRLDWKDARCEPVHERHIVAVTADKSHGRVGMRIDKAWQHKVSFHFTIRNIPANNVCSGRNCANEAVFDGHGMIAQYGAVFILGKQNMGMDYGIAGHHVKDPFKKIQIK